MEERRDKMKSYAFAYQGRLCLQSNKNFWREPVGEGIGPDHSLDAVCIIEGIWGQKEKPDYAKVVLGFLGFLLDWVPYPWY